MGDMERKSSILKGSGLNYLYKVSTGLEKYLVLGTLVRAIGHGKTVRVVSADMELAALLEELKSLLKEKLLFVNEEEPDKKVKILVVDGLENDLGHWRSLCGDLVHIVAINVVGEFDLISEISSERINKRGVVAITGGGKGKTTLGLGMAVLNCLKGLESLVVSWLKEKKNEGLSWSIGEHFFENKIEKKLLEIETTGLGFFGSPNMDRVKGVSSYDEHRKKAYEGMELVKKRIIVGGYRGLVVLDEYVDTVKEIAGNIEYPLIDLSDAREFLKYLTSKKVKVVVTGRRVTDDWSDLVSESIEIKEIQHPWKSMGLSAVPGLDF